MLFKNNFVKKKSVDVCLSPELLHLYDVGNSIVVMVDILRASSSMTTAFANGVRELIPVATLEECQKLKEQGFLTAAERDGKKIEGFDFGNSPYSYIESDVEGESVAITTTNGTLAINKSKQAIQVIVGSFLNKTAVNNYLKQTNENVLVLCAGWKGQANLEDTLYAGAVVEGLSDKFDIKADGAMIAFNLYQNAKDDLNGFLENCNHVQRLKKQKGILRDIEFCLKEDMYSIVPVLEGDKLKKAMI
ncbi:MAG: 2-phosphosulfolactate phosphatase [Cytophagales bacterium]|nr:2-phosphosulfolactate phosphatase [Cytophagales bacterium]